MSSIQLNLFNIYYDRLPRHGFGTDDLTNGVRLLATSELIKRAIVQHNAKHSIGWLVYDIDRGDSALVYHDRHVPPPNIVVVNLENGHGHYLYGLERPIHNYHDARKAPLRYMGAIDVALTDALGADPGYSKLLSKNPYHGRWHTIYPRMELYDLDELADWVDLSGYQDKRKPLPPVGLGRNCTLFHTLRIWAYRQRRQPDLSQDFFFERVRAKAHAINAQFSPPLPASEVRATAKSVAKWTWRNMSPESFRERQRALSARGNAVKRRQARARANDIVQAKLSVPALTHREIADMFGIHLKTVQRALAEVDKPHIR